jgi:hypothetical protein
MVEGRLDAATEREAELTEREAGGQTGRTGGE